MHLLSEQVRQMVDHSLPLVSNLANVSAVLNRLGDLNWCGFYLAEQGNLVLGPFQGEPACTVIPCGKGVCGTAMATGQTQVVPDVFRFPGHIACSSASRSEIVVPIRKDGRVVGVIDLDAPVYDRFGEPEKVLLEEAAAILSELF